MEYEGPTNCNENEHRKAEKYSGDSDTINRAECISGEEIKTFFVDHCFITFWMYSRPAGQIEPLLMQAGPEW